MNTFVLQQNKALHSLLSNTMQSQNIAWYCWASYITCSEIAWYCWVSYAMLCLLQHKCIHNIYKPWTHHVCVYKYSFLRQVISFSVLPARNSNRKSAMKNFSRFLSAAVVMIWRVLPANCQGMSVSSYNACCYNIILHNFYNIM
jgi:hypothetical protein